MRVLSALLALSLAAVLLTGCGISKAKNEAEPVAQAYFECIKGGDCEAALDLFSAQFYEQTPRDEWQRMIEKVQEKLGDLQSYELVQWSVFRGSKGGLTGTMVQLQYQATYEEHPAQVSVVVHKPVGGSGFKIRGMNINSPGLLID